MNTKEGENVNKVYLGDCLELMKYIPDKSIDMILCDLPYGTTACKWDTIIPFEPLWTQYKRIIKDNMAIVLCGGEPFSSYLRMSNIKDYKYDWYWRRDRASNFLNAKHQPLRNIEIISVFSAVAYNPIMENWGEPSHSIGIARGKMNNGSTQGKRINVDGNLTTNLKYPRTLLSFSVPHPPIHSTQKPVALFEYLIKTYTNEGDLVLDNCAGSGTTAIACLNTNRNYILMEKEPKYYEIILERIARTVEGKINDNTGE